MTRIEYQRIDLKAPVRVYLGRGKVSDVEAVNGTKITRVTDGPVDFFLVSGPNVVVGTEIASGNVASGVRAKVPTVRAFGGKKSAAEGPDGAA